MTFQMPMVARGEGSFEDMLGVKDIRRVGSAVLFGSHSASQFKWFNPCQKCYTVTHGFVAK